MNTLKRPSRNLGVRVKLECLSPCGL